MFRVMRAEVKRHGHRAMRRNAGAGAVCSGFSFCYSAGVPGPRRTPGMTVSAKTNRWSAAGQDNLRPRRRLAVRRDATWPAEPAAFMLDRYGTGRPATRQQG